MAKHILQREGKAHYFGTQQKEETRKENHSNTKFHERISLTYGMPFRSRNHPEPKMLQTSRIITPTAKRLDFLEGTR